MRFLAVELDVDLDDSEEVLVHHVVIRWVDHHGGRDVFERSGV